MSRETDESKGRRYVQDGRLVVLRAARDQVDAICRGSGEFHRISYRRGDWACSCPARGVCSHLVAVQLCTAPRSQDWDGAVALWRVAS
jgi:uncharacterized Zn finger protein